MHRDLMPSRLTLPTCMGKPRSVWHVTNKDLIVERYGVFTPDENFNVIRYTFWRQRHVREVPGIYLVICRAAVAQGNRGVFVGQTKNLKKQYADHFNERDNEELRLLIENCADPEFAWLPVFELGRLTETEQSYITQYKDVVINIQYL